MSTTVFIEREENPTPPINKVTLVLDLKTAQALRKLIGGTSSTDRIKAINRSDIYNTPEDKHIEDLWRALSTNLDREGIHHSTSV